MADGLSIPGVTDRYKTNDLVEALMETERVPLKREQERLESYQNEQGAWRDVSQKMSTLRESVKALYSFENPFSNKTATSSDEGAVTVDAGRDADFGTFKIDVIRPATADRFLSGNIDRNMHVEAGKYTFSVGGKTIEFNWKGGKLNDFVSALNKRGSNVIKASLIGVSARKTALVIEGMKTGGENRLIFGDKALEFATSIDMVSPAEVETTALPSSLETFGTPRTRDGSRQYNMPAISKDGVSASGDGFTIPARGGIEVPIPEDVRSGGNEKIEFILRAAQTRDITEDINASLGEPELPEPGVIKFKGITLINAQSETTLPERTPEERAPVEPVADERYVFIKNADGSEVEVATPGVTRDGQESVSISLNDYPGARSLVILNSNTGREVSVSVPQAHDAAKDAGFDPNHAITQAEDAEFRYEGITLTRPSNDIDDVIPHVTLHLHEPTDRPVSIRVDANAENAKDALITFVGKYNQVLAEMNILTSNKPEVISELDYLSSEEQEAAEKKLGLFQGDFTLTNGKGQLQRIVGASYANAENADITMLSQIGISTNAAGGTGYTASQMRGYLEIDEKKLDEQLAANMGQIKDLFGYDSDGDLIIDSGIGYLLDRQLTSWVQTGGIIATKTASLDSKIKSSNTKISNLQTKLDDKEAELKRKYSSMEGTLNSLESQQNSITNFSNSFNRNK